MESADAKIVAILTRHMSAINARSLLHLAARRVGVEVDRLHDVGPERLLAALRGGIKLFCKDAATAEACLADVTTAVREASRREGDDVPPTALTFPVRTEEDVITARTRGREFCRELGFSDADQAKIATAVSELTRNIVMYAGQGELTIRRLDDTPLSIEIVACDRGSGIDNIEDVLAGRFKSKTGMGRGLRGVKRLMDAFAIESQAGTGTCITVRKRLR